LRHRDTAQVKVAAQQRRGRRRSGCLSDDDLVEVIVRLKADWHLAGEWDPRLSVRQLLIEDRITVPRRFPLCFEVLPPHAKVSIQFIAVGEIRGDRSVDVLEIQDRKCLRNAFG
jgi:hypothetical protein